MTTFSAGASDESTTNDLIPTDSIYQQYEPYFSDAAKKALDKKIFSVVHQYNEWRGDLKWRGAENLFNLLADLGIRSADDHFPGYPDNAGWYRQCDLVHHFGYTVDSSRVNEATLRLIEDINNMVQEDAISGAMCRLIRLGLSNYDGTPSNRTAVFSYLAVKYNKQDEVLANYAHCLFKDGGVPPELK